MDAAKETAHGVHEEQERLEFLTMPIVPKTMAEALQCPDAKQWHSAFGSEMKFMQDDNVYDLVMLLESKWAIDS